MRLCYENSVSSRRLAFREVSCDTVCVCMSVSMAAGEICIASVSILSSFVNKYMWI